jgi:hypothetical protein
MKNIVKKVLLSRLRLPAAFAPELDRAGKIRKAKSAKKPILPTVSLLQNSAEV